MIHEFRSPIPVNTPHGPGYAIYVQCGGTFENDIWCVTLKDGGVIRHYTTMQLTMQVNGTFGIHHEETP